jgi:hypothetical protein
MTEHHLVRGAESHCDVDDLNGSEMKNQNQIHISNYGIRLLII